jgi:transposase
VIDQPGAAPISVIDQPESGSVSSITSCSCWVCRNAAAVVPQMMAVTVRAAKTNIVIVALLRQRLLRRACHAMNLARERGVPLNSGLIALIERRYNAILAEGLALQEVQPALAKPRRRGRPPRRVGHNLLLRLSIRKQDVLRFLTDPRVPFTNNLVEQDGPEDLRRVSLPVWCEGLRHHPLRSLNRQEAGGWDMIQTLTATPACLITDIRLA